MIRRPGRSAAIALVACAALLGGCTSGGPDPGTAAPSSAAPSSGVGVSSPTAGSTVASTARSASSTAPTTTSLVPLTPDGLQTGPGVEADRITLGLLIDPALDRGFSAGVRLWQSTLNRTTGVCGRRIELRAAETSDTDETVTNYREIAPETLGLLTLTGSAVQSELAAHLVEDQIPAVTPVGRSADLSAWGPMIVGATEDILAINVESYLVQAGIVRPGSELGVLTDGSADALEEQAGLQWFADRSGIVLRTFSDPATADWAGLTAVAVLGGPAATRQVLTATGPEVTVVTTLDGYDSSSVDPAWSGRLLVSTPTTALDSDNPAAKAVMTAYSESGGTDPGPLLFAGYASGATWGRLLQQACSQADLTRSGIRTAATDLPPAPADSLLGATDLRAPVTDGLPATPSVGRVEGRGAGARRTHGPDLAAGRSGHLRLRARRLSSPDGQPGVPPCGEPADHIGGPPETEIEQRGRGQARCVPLRTDHQDPHVVIGRLRDPGIGGRVQPPFQDVPLDHRGARDLSLLRSLRLRTDVHQQRALSECFLRGSRFHPGQPLPGPVEDLGNGGHGFSGSSPSTVRVGSRPPLPQR